MVTTKRKHADAVFKAIADPTRREILRLLRREELTVGGLAENFRISRPAISKHLRLLRAAGLVSTRKQGAASICRLNAKPLKAVDQWIGGYRALWKQNLRNLKQFVEEKS
jgi:DNA-binding transcriptional ArsR family regulator